VTLVILLDADEMADLRWLKLDGRSVIERGEDANDLAVDGEGERLEQDVVAVAPADAVTLRYVDVAGLDALTQAQWQAAARLQADDFAIGNPVDRHVSAGVDHGQGVIAVTSQSQMSGWIARLNEIGFDPGTIVPAQLLLPRPDAGFVAGDVGNGRNVRGRHAAFADDERLTPLLTDGEAIVDVEPDLLETSMANAIAQPMVNLRSSGFVLRRGLLDNAVVRRRLIWLAGTLLAITFAIPFAQGLRNNLAARKLDAAVMAQARSVDRDADDPAVIADRLAALRGGGAGFTATYRAVATAVGVTSGVELSSVRFDNDGTMTVSARAPGGAELQALAENLRMQGFDVVLGPLSENQGSRVSEIKVRGQ
jgi:general secretion pathway protein L